jgi:ribosomal protein S18 acetylase RimI-like enzyme
VSTDDEAVLDNPTWAALTGPHAHLAERHGSAARYPDDISPFVALEDQSDPRAWRDLAALAGSGGQVMVSAGTGANPLDWEIVGAIKGVQLVATALAAVGDPDAVRLTAADVPEMLALVLRAEPGPFAPRTIELGPYFGLRDRGRLVAMAGCRLHPPGWVEVSAVCTDREYRGRGMATRLIGAVAAEIAERGHRCFLHAAADNTNAIRLYESIGFSLRRTSLFQALLVP